VILHLDALLLHHFGRDAINHHLLIAQLLHVPDGGIMISE
jgi:hypothetical protein